jgi:hypothetical protein
MWFSLRLCAFAGNKRFKLSQSDENIPAKSQSRILLNNLVYRVSIIQALYESLKPIGENCMKRPLFLLLLLLLLGFGSVEAQKRNVRSKPKPKSFAGQKFENGSDRAVVIDERLAVLRAAPSLFAKPIQRMRRGRLLSISETREADGVTFYRVVAMPSTAGWVQKEAVAGKSRRGDDERLARLVQASDGFDQIERARIFLENFPVSPFRPSILLLFGDLMEEIALKLSADAAKRLSRREMAASGAPLHSFYLNYSSLDRYQRLGIGFVFNSSTRLFHYDGASWREIIAKSPGTNEAGEANRRLDALKEKMQQRVTARLCTKSLSTKAKI